MTVDRDPEVLPTHLTLVLDRIDTSQSEPGSDPFFGTSYIVEAVIKSIAIALYAGLRHASPESAYAIAYELVHADGLGTWDEAIAQMTQAPLVGYLSPEFHPTLAWLTKRRSARDDARFTEAIGAADEVLKLCGTDLSPDRRARSLRHLLAELVLIRNKTKAHGAFGPDFYVSATDIYRTAANGIYAESPLFSADWLYLSPRVGQAGVRGHFLRGNRPTHLRDREAVGLSVAEPGVYIRLRPDGRLLFLGELLRTNRDCQEFFVPNGHYATNGDAEFINYANGRTQRYELSRYLLPPAPLPPSDTAALEVLDVQSDVFGNLPLELPLYVERRGLEAELRTRLLDSNHHIVTLHGQGGIGKTSLALRVAHELARQSPPHFETILWFSARDIDLRPTGPSVVKQQVLDLKSICDAYGRLVGEATPQARFAEVLQEPTAKSGKGTLFVFDNFETLDNAREIHEFLDTHVHLPNKVLMTSRERAFKADFPIEVRGMEADEAAELCRRAARELAIEGLVDEKVIDSVYDVTEGHPYVMRVVLGEIAKEGRYVPPKSLIPRRQDIVRAVFERSFNRLSHDGRWVFLVVGNWRSAVAELALLVVCGRRGVDVEAGIEECMRLALVVEEESGDGSRCFWAPELARSFARQKLESDPDKFAVSEDLELIQKFGVLERKRVSSFLPDVAVERFMEWALREAQDASDERQQQLDDMLETIAELWPRAWEQVARFRMERGFDKRSIEQALRRLVEERPLDKKAWLLWAEYARKTGEDAAAIAAMVSATGADPEDVELLCETALQLCHFVDTHKTDIPKSRRGVYLAGIRERMERIAGDLTATGLSRLAWLFLLEDNKQKAYEYAAKGSQLEPDNMHCRRLTERLMWDGLGQAGEGPLD